MSVSELEWQPMTRAGVPVGSGRSAGFGLGWDRVAGTVSQTVPPAEIDRIWLFAPVRQEDREWGTAVVSRRIAGDRRRLYTASYVLVIRGRDRGQGKVVVDEVGESPARVVHEVIAGVQARAGEPAAPEEIAPELWYGDADDEPAAQG